MVDREVHTPPMCLHPETITINLRQRSLQWIWRNFLGVWTVRCNHGWKMFILVLSILPRGNYLPLVDEYCPCVSYQPRDSHLCSHLLIKLICFSVSAFNHCKHRGAHDKQIITDYICHPNEMQFWCCSRLRNAVMWRLLIVYLWRSAADILFVFTWHARCLSYQVFVVSWRATRDKRR